jgi:hypothetical protein
MKHGPLLLVSLHTLRQEEFANLRNAQYASLAWLPLMRDSLLRPKHVN